MTDKERLELAIEDIKRLATLYGSITCEQNKFSITVCARCKNYEECGSRVCGAPSLCEEADKTGYQLREAFVWKYS